MKKAICIIGIVITVGIIVFGSLYVIDHNRMENNEHVVFSTWGEKYIPAKEINAKEAIELVKNIFDEKSKETITNFDNPKIEEVVFDSKPSIAYFEKEVNIVGKSLYKITFRTTNDGLLGPIVVYVDKVRGKLIGIDYRY